MTDVLNNTDTNPNAPQSLEPNAQTNGVVSNTDARRSRQNKRNRSAETAMTDAANNIDKDTNTPTDSDPHSSRSDSRTAVRSQTQRVFV